MFSAFHGSLDNPKSVGTNNLLQEFAELVLCPEDIAYKYGYFNKVKNVIETKADISTEYKEIYSVIGDNPIDVNDIARNCNISIQEAVSKITMLELEGKIKKIAGNRYIREE